ncbi:MAG: hypothetical protein JW913_03480 [Chitinispirillaceae bacterium]|nr:hypothetical protein [Chitinispirillaceae bacterium]
MENKEQPVICSIIAKNYLAFARTLCASFREHHPDGRCFIVITDNIEGKIRPENETFEILPIGALAIPRLQEFCFKYNITELSTAVKPYLLQYLLKIRQVRKALYLDPDIYITRRLDGLFDLLDIHDIILTPHLDADYPDDGKYPDDGHILMSGIYNLGFIGIRAGENTDRFLSWWAEKCYDKCVVLHKRGYFVDQRFIDLAVLFFHGIGIVRDIGYNVAYWNLHSREVTSVNGQWRCNGGPLYFYHFSDYKPEMPDRISGHQMRYSLNRLPGLELLFRKYRELLFANGYEESRKWPYTYQKLRNGWKIKDIYRKIYRLNIATIGADDPFRLHPVSLLGVGAKWFVKKAIRRLSGNRY